MAAPIRDRAKLPNHPLQSLNRGLLQPADTFGFPALKDGSSVRVIPDGEAKFSVLGKFCPVKSAQPGKNCRPNPLFFRR